MTDQSGRPAADVPRVRRYDAGNTSEFIDQVAAAGHQASVRQVIQAGPADRAPAWRQPSGASFVVGDLPHD